MVADVTQPERGVLPQGNVYIEARFGALFEGLLFDDGWDADEPWTPLQRDLAEPVEDCGVRIEVTGPERARVRAAVQRAAFDGSTFTDERWHAMAAGLPVHRRPVSGRVRRPGQEVLLPPLPPR